MRTFIPRRTSFLVEPLEKRQLLSGVPAYFALGVNLLTNGDAESDVGASVSTTSVNPTGWSEITAGGPIPFTAVQYGTAGFPTSGSPGPADRGHNFFAGGPDNAEEIATQTVNVSALADGIDAGEIKANLSGWLGGFDSQEDRVILSIRFLDKNQAGIGSDLVLPTVTAEDRGDVTGLIQRSAGAAVPTGTRFVQVIYDSIGSAGTYNDGYADDLSLTMTSSAKTGFITGHVYNDVNGDATIEAGDKGVKGITVYADKNNDFKLDKGEIKAVTDKSGAYTLANVPRGPISVQIVLPASYRQVYSVITGPIVGGMTNFSSDFGISQSSLIFGNVFNDANANQKFDAKEKGIAGVTVYLDFNNNGQLDPFELKATADARGYFQFSVPFGTYVVRIQVPKGYKATNNLNGRTLIFGKGQDLEGEDFGVRKA